MPGVFMLSCTMSVLELPGGRGDHLYCGMLCVNARRFHHSLCIFHTFRLSSHSEA